MNSVHTRPVEGNSEKKSKKFKKLKNPFRHYFQPKWDEIGGEREKKILDSNSVNTRPGKENSEKNSKKIAKISKPLSTLLLAKTG